MTRKKAGDGSNPALFRLSVAQYEKDWASFCSIVYVQETSPDKLHISGSQFISLLFAHSKLTREREITAFTDSTKHNVWFHKGERGQGQFSCFRH